jgi:predicted secreted protein
VKEDRRSRRLILVCHCVLNQNSKLQGIAEYPDVYRPVVDLILEHQVGIYQLPCPEMSYLGISRWSATKDQYDSPFFRRHCRALAMNVIDEMTDYLRHGYHIVAVLGMDGSPACGVELTPQAANGRWGGRIETVGPRRLVPDSGTFMEILQAEASARDMSVPFIGLPEVEGARPLDEALAELEVVLSG